MQLKDRLAKPAATFPDALTDKAKEHHSGNGISNA
jgi:hypothetical protein